MKIKPKTIMAAIEKITQSELQQTKWASVGKKHPVRRAIEALEVGEAIKISGEAFNWKRLTPKVFCNAISKTSKKRFQVLRPLLQNGTFGAGWVVERLE